jgi:hypothetical protein
MFAAVHRYASALLVFSDFTPPEQIADQVAQSIHARDYHVTVDYACNILYAALEYAPQNVPIFWG